MSIYSEVMVPKPERQNGLKNCLKFSFPRRNNQEKMITEELEINLEYLTKSPKME